MTKILAISNQKGGVGKTTTAVNLSAALGMKGKKVLLVDLDPQGNATSSSGLEKNKLTDTAYDLLINDSETK
jgi:chromosome partitioning protein